MPTKRTTTHYAQRIGLDVGTNSVKGVEVVERGSETVILSAGVATVPGVRSKHDLPDQAAVVQAIKSLRSSAKFESTHVVLALPPEAVYIKWLHLEATDKEDLYVTAHTAATRGAPFPADDAVIDYRVLSGHARTSPNVHFVMLVAASGAAIDALLDAAGSAGLEPIAVDIGAAAALRSIDTRKGTSGSLWSGQPLAHCILGARNTTIAVVRGGYLEFARTVPVGGNDFTECVAEHLSIDWAEADRIKESPGTRLVDNGSLVVSLEGRDMRVPCENVVGRLAREIQRSLRFFSSQFAEGSYLGMIGAATMGGGGALLKGMGTCLQQHGIDITSIVNPFGGFSVDAEGGLRHVGNAAPQFTTAVGLATGDYWTAAPDADELELAA